MCSLDRTLDDPTLARIAPLFLFIVTLRLLAWTLRWKLARPSCLLARSTSACLRNLLLLSQCPHLHDFRTTFLRARQRIGGLVQVSLMARRASLTRVLLMVDTTITATTHTPSNLPPPTTPTTRIACTTPATSCLVYRRYLLYPS